MQPQYSLSKSLPPLAWLAGHAKDGDVVHVMHGRHVETQPRFFIEGAWAGAFPEGELHKAEALFGSGAAFDGEGVTFVPSSATTDYLYYRDEPDRFCISNSLPALLAHLDDGLLEDCDQYVEINRSIQDGVYDYRAEIPTRRGAVRRLLWWNLRLDAGGVHPQEKNPPPAFPRYRDYRDYLDKTIQALFGNARHPARKHPLLIFSTQSRGYDSTAINALAAPHGIDRIFTSPESKDKGAFYRPGRQADNPSDDGTDICSVLGQSCTLISRRSFETGVPYEHYFWACHDNNQDLNLQEIHQYIDRPTLLLTGHLGESWYTRSCAGARYSKMDNDALFCWSQAGHGMAEIRLVVGYVQAALPFIGARRRSDIFRITASEEMAPWTLNNKYDRPIARRIAEEAGVPREMFGQVKLASIVHLPTPNLPTTSGLRQAFFKHLRKKRLLGMMGIGLLPGVQRINSFIYWKRPEKYFTNRQNHPLLWRMGYYWSRALGRPLRFPLLWCRIDSYLYAYCANKVRDEYSTHLPNHQRPPTKPLP